MHQFLRITLAEIQYIQDVQTRLWGKKGELVIRPKSRGSSIMVSDFVFDERNGYLRLTDKEYERVRAKDPTRAFLGIWRKPRWVLE